MLFALSYTRCSVPAQESQDIAIAVKCTEFYEVVSHPLKVNCLCISYQMKRALQNGKIRIDIFAGYTSKNSSALQPSVAKAFFAILPSNCSGYTWVVGIGGHFVYFAILVYISVIDVHQSNQPGGSRMWACQCLPSSAHSPKPPRRI